MKILMIVTSHDQLGNTGRKMGVRLEELAMIYFIFHDAGIEVAFASPKGGQAPLDPRRGEPDGQTEDTRRIEQDTVVMNALAHTTRLAEIDATAFDAIFIPDSYGSLWDLTNDRKALFLIEEALAAEKAVALVSHASGILTNVKAPNGSPIAKGRVVTGFTNVEEASVRLVEVVPYLLEDVLKEQAGTFSAAAEFAAHVVRDGFLITGQNPNSARRAAQILISVLEEKSNRSN